MEPTAQPKELDEFFAHAYRELRRVAHYRLRKCGDLTLLDTTGLVHEAYLRLSRVANPPEGQLASMAYVASTMRSVVVDFLRRRHAERHGGDTDFTSLDEDRDEPAHASAEAEVLGIDDILHTLSDSEPRLTQVVEMRFFGGYTEAEIAAALSINERTVRRDWEKARALLRAALGR